MMDSDYEEEEEVVLRGIIEASDHKYFILNEIFSELDCKQFSAIKITSKNLNSEKIEVDEHRFSIRCFDKKWISEEVLRKEMEVFPEKIHKFFDCFKNRFEENRIINHTNIQQMKEYIDTDNYIYVVTEYCDLNLQDYILDIKDKFFNDSITIEFKLRNIFLQIFTAMFELNDLHGFTFASLLSPREIMIVEKEKNLIIKFPHPFFSNFQTILKLASTKPNFPYYLAPEVYALFTNKAYLTNIQKKDIYEFSNLFPSTNSTFDLFALSFFMYEIFFNRRPILHDNIVSANKIFFNNFKFILQKNVISDTFFDIIENGLKIENNRMNYKDLKLIIEIVERENLDPEFEKNTKPKCSKELISKAE